MPKLIPCKNLILMTNYFFLLLYLDSIEFVVLDAMCLETHYQYECFDSCTKPSFSTLFYLCNSAKKNP